jgi:eukaryotic-like serine/threonine-protein kinase
VPFDLLRRATTGPSVSIVPAVTTTLDGAADFDVAADGTLVYVPGGVASVARFELAWYARDGRSEKLDAPPRAYLYPRISPNGTRVLLDIRDEDYDIYLWDLGRRTLRNVTRNAALDRFPVWAPDGRYFVFVSNRQNGRSTIFRQRADGTGDVESLSEDSPVLIAPGAFTRDGKHLLVGRGGDVLLLALDGSRMMTPLLHDPAVESHPVLSPDGRWLAYHSDESGRSEIWVRPFPNVNEDKQVVSTAGGVQAWWSRTGGELFFKDLASAIMVVRVGAGDRWAASTPTAVVPSPTINAFPQAAATFDVALDGRILAVRQPTSAAPPSAPADPVVVQHWFEELKRLVPAD